MKMSISIFFLLINQNFNFKLILNFYINDDNKLYFFRHINNIKNLKTENEQITNKQLENEKLVDIFAYFFKKIQSYYNSESNLKYPNNKNNLNNKQEYTDHKDKLYLFSLSLIFNFLETKKKKYLLGNAN